jgi:predicted permease
VRAVRAFLRRALGIFDRGRRDRELQAELESHLQLHIDDGIRAGLTPADARRAALLKFGPVEAIKDQYRERFTIPLVEAAVVDLRYGARMLRRQPAFSTLIVVTLALGVGAAVAMFGLVDALMLRAPRHVREPGRVVRIEEIANYPRYLDVASRARALDLAGFTRSTVSLGRGPEALPLRAECVTPSYFPVLGAQPVLGRTFTPDEDQTGRQLTAVISYHLWRNRFGGEASVLGRLAEIAGQPYTIVGVAPAGFTGIGREAVDAWILLARHLAACTYRMPDIYQRESFWLTTIGRVRDGYSLEQAEADARAADVNPDTLQRPRADGTIETVRTTPPIRLRPLTDDESGSEGRLALWLAGGGALLLLIGCANAAGLLMIRALDRRREMAMRLQLGATRARVLSQLLVEGVVIALACALAAATVALWIIALLRAFYPLAALEDLPDARLLGVSATLALLAALVSWIVPAAQSARADVALSLRTGPAMHERGRFRRLLLVTQVAIALVLVAGAGLFVRSVWSYREKLSYDLDRALAVSVDLRKAGYTEAREIRARYQALLDRVQQLADVEAAALSSSSLALADRGGSVTGIGRQAFSESSCCHAEVAVTPDYFAAAGLAIVRGRAFGPGDTIVTPPGVVILDEDLARAMFRDEDPLGQCVFIGFGDTRCAEVVGVSESARRGPLRKGQLDSQFFVPLVLGQDGSAIPELLLVRPRTGARGAVESLSAAIRRAGADLPYVRIAPLSELANLEARSWRLGATMFALFGVSAVVLAMVGLYAALAFAVRRRVPEIGVRIAFGARPADIVRLVLREGLVVVGAGLLVGGAAAAGLARYVESLLFEVAPADPPTFAMAILLIGIAATLGCLVPSLRAARIDPAAAVRAE